MKKVNSIAALAAACEKAENPVVKIELGDTKTDADDDRLAKGIKSICKQFCLSLEGVGYFRYMARVEGHAYGDMALLFSIGEKLNTELFNDDLKARDFKYWYREDKKDKCIAFPLTVSVLTESEYEKTVGAKKADTEKSEKTEKAKRTARKAEKTLKPKKTDTEKAEVIVE